MTAHLQTTPRILIVEDNPAQARAMELSLMSASRDLSSLVGILPFDINKAASVNGGRKYLDDAERPYDICLLDLSLPENDKESRENPRGGYDIIGHIGKTGAAKRVIIVSVFNEYKYVIEAFRGGAFDFITKPYEEDALRAQVVNCLRNLLAKESASIFEQRVKGLIPHAEKGLAHYFTQTFSTLLNSTLRATAEIERYAHEHYGLDLERNEQDGLMRQLRQHRESTTKAREDWLKRQENLFSDDEMAQKESVEVLLNQTNETLLPCLTVKRMQLFLDLPQLAQSTVLTFQQDVQAVLKEIILGGLSELPDYGDPHRMEVTMIPNDRRAIIRFEDDLEPIPKEIAEKINEGYSIVSDPQFGRRWGLSIAQHIALRGGGDLLIEPQLRGNIITYRIPLCHV